MNPIICFDELDKVSETAKGDEIVNMLIHMTDSQNNKFQDNYFPGIDIIYLKCYLYCLLMMKVKSVVF